MESGVNFNTHFNFGGRRERAENRKSYSLSLLFGVVRLKNLNIQFNNLKQLTNSIVISPKYNSLICVLIKQRRFEVEHLVELYIVAKKKTYSVYLSWNGNCDR